MSLAVQQQTLFDGSLAARCPLAAATRRSQLGLYRHGVQSQTGTLASAPAQDAHLVIVQLRDQPAHDFWADGRHRPMAFSPRGAMTIVDMRAESSALLRSPVDSLHLHLPRVALDDLAEEAGAPPITRLAVEGGWKADDHTIQQLGPLLVQALEAPSAAAKLFVDHLLLAAALHVVAAFGGMRPNSVQRGGLAPWQVGRAKDLIAASLSKEVSLLEVAEACRLSLAHFSRAFKYSTGTTPHGWLQVCRVERARELLLKSDLSLADVAIACGFADQSHLTRIFKRITREGPGAWRRSRRHS